MMKKLLEIRAQREALLDQIEEIAAKPRDLDTATAALLSPALGRMIDQGEQILLSATHPTGIHSDLRDPQNLAGLILALIGPKEIMRLARERMQAAAQGGLSPDARAKSIASLRAECVALEEREEREVLRLEMEGHAVTRRGDADPALLLRVWEETPTKPAVA